MRQMANPVVTKFAKGEDALPKGVVKSSPGYGEYVTTSQTSSKVILVTPGAEYVMQKPRLNVSKYLNQKVTAKHILQYVGFMGRTR